jgi:hypothetical protein
MYCFILNIISQINPVQKLYESMSIKYSDVLLYLSLKIKIKITVVPNDSQANQFLIMRYN